MTITLLLLLVASVLTGDDRLLQMGQKHSCIKEVIIIFVANKDCSSLDDIAKSKLALKMTQCLLAQMGKTLPPQCTSKSSQNCELSGDSWNTFSTFFTHIDNLCHFYWEMFHHEKAELLINQLSESTRDAEKMLRQNSYQTQKILSLQQKMHVSIEQSLGNQQKMTEMINKSHLHLLNLTGQMQSFVRKIHEDIDNNYATIRNILEVMNEGLSQMMSIQSYMTAQLNSIQGMVYFLCIFFAILFMTSFKKYQQARYKCLIAFFIHFGLELVFKNLIQSAFGVNKLRYAFIVIEVIIICNRQHQFNQLEVTLQNHFNTPRLKRVFSTVYHQNQFLKLQKFALSSDTNKLYPRIISMRNSDDNPPSQGE